MFGGADNTCMIGKDRRGGVLNLAHGAGDSVAVTRLIATQITLIVVVLV